MKNTLEGINSRLGDTRMHKSSGRYNNGNHPNRMAKRKTNFKNENTLRDL